MSHLGIELQISLAGSTGIDGELGRPVHDAASGLQARSKGFHLCYGQERGLGWGQEEEQSTRAQARQSVGAATPPCLGSSLVELAECGL